MLNNIRIRPWMVAALALPLFACSVADSLDHSTTLVAPDGSRAITLVRQVSTDELRSIHGAFVPYFAPPEQPHPIVIVGQQAGKYSLCYVWTDQAPRQAFDAFPGLCNGQRDDNAPDAALLVGDISQALSAQDMVQWAFSHPDQARKLASAQYVQATHEMAEKLGNRATGEQ